MSLQDFPFFSVLSIIAAVWYVLAAYVRDKASDSINKIELAQRRLPGTIDCSAGSVLHKLSSEYHFNWHIWEHRDQNSWIYAAVWCHLLLTRSIIWDANRTVHIIPFFLTQSQSIYFYHPLQWIFCRNVLSGLSHKTGMLYTHQLARRCSRSIQDCRHLMMLSVIIPAVREGFQPSMPS